ncbi:hypothetical protein GmHk_14G041123 [Glycine max]|nr:hypothetical protein GmHk_14G041123 [Glycine max]
MIMLQNTEIKTSFETSTHVVGHIFKVTLYKKLLSMVSRYALNQIAAEFERVNYVGIDSSRCGHVMRTTHDLPCACELARYIVGTITLNIIHMFCRRLSFSNQGLSEPEVSINEEMETIIKQFKELDVCGKVTLKSKLQEISYLDLNSVCAPSEKVKTKGAQKKSMTKHQRSTKCDPSYWEHVDALPSVQNRNSLVKQSASSSKQPKPRRSMPMLGQFYLCIHDFIENIVDVKPDDNCGYHAIVVFLGIGENSWSLVSNHLLKKLTKWFDEYINLLSGIDKFEELKWLLLFDGLSMVTIDKWMNITDMGYVIASRYNDILKSTTERLFCTSRISKRRLSLTTNNFVMVYTLSLSSKVVAYTIY